MGKGDVVLLDYAGDNTVASWMIGDMTVVERLVREAARDGASRIIVRGAELATPLPRLTVPVEVVPVGAAVPDHATLAPTDVVAGVRLTDEASRKRAWSALMQTCRRPYDGLGDRYFIRAISLRLTALFLSIGATPNQVTVANIVVGLAACNAAVHRGWFALAGGLIIFNVILDSSDGELARLRHMFSRRGMWLDNVSDDVIDNAFIGCLGLALGGMWTVVAPLAAGGRAIVALCIYLAVHRAGHPGDVMAFRWWFDRADDTPTDRFVARVTPLTLLRAVGRRDLYILLWGLLCIVGAPAIACGLGVAICAAYIGLGIGQTITKGWRPAR